MKAFFTALRAWLSTYWRHTLVASAVTAASATAIVAAPRLAARAVPAAMSVNGTPEQIAYFGPVPVYADAGAFVGPSMTLAPSQNGFFTANIRLVAAGASDGTGHCWYQTKWGASSTTDGGVILSPTSVDAGVPQDNECGSQFAGMPAPTLVQVGNAVQVFVSSPVAAAVTVNLDWIAEPLAPFVLSVSPSTLTVDAGGNVVVTTTPGAALGASAGVLGAIVAADGGVSGGVALKCSAVPTDQSGSSANCFSPPGAGLLSDGGFITGGVSLTSQAGPFPMAGGFAYVAGTGGSAPTITKVVPNVALSAAGGQTVTITGTAFVNGSTTFAAADAGALTSVSCTGAPTTCTAVVPAGPSNAGSGATTYPISVTTSGGGPVTGGTLATAIGYSSSNTTIKGQWQADTISGSTAATWVDNTGQQNLTAATSSPSVVAAFNSSLFKAISCNGSTDILQVSALASPNSTTYATNIVFQYPSVASSTNGLYQLGSTLVYSVGVYATSSGFLSSDLSSAALTIASSDTVAHVLQCAESGTDTVNCWLDGTASVNNPGNNHNGTSTYGSAVVAVCTGYVIGGYFGNAKIAYFDIRNAAMGSTDRANEYADLKAFYGTP